jgi:hypothetical protein
MMPLSNSQSGRHYRRYFGMREQEVANISLFVMTTWNAILGILMIFEILPVSYGMYLAFGGMCVIMIASWRTLMGDERPWESPRKYRERISK